MYEPITVGIDRAYGGGAYRSHSINFTGRLVQLIEKDYTKIRLYEWADRGYIVYLVHVEEATPRKGYTAVEVSRAYPEFDKGRFLFLGCPRSSPTR